MSHINLLFSHPLFWRLQRPPGSKMKSQLFCSRLQCDQKVKLCYVNLLRFQVSFIAVPSYSLLLSTGISFLKLVTALKTHTCSIDFMVRFILAARKWSPVISCRQTFGYSLPDLSEETNHVLLRQQIQRKYIK